MKSQIAKLLLCLTVLFSACEQESNLDFSEINITTENNTIVDVNIPWANGNSEIALNINTTLNQHTALALQADSLSINEDINIEKHISLFNNEFEDFKTKFPDSNQLWEAQIDGEIMHQSPKIISLVLTAYTNTGGAHGNLVISFLNFNAQTGLVISNEMLFSDVARFKKIAQVYFENEIKNNPDLIIDNFNLPENIGFNDEGVILLYNTYEIAPYAAGVIEFTIPIDEVIGYLNFY